LGQDILERGGKVTKAKSQKLQLERKRAGIYGSGCQEEGEKALKNTREKKGLN